MKGIPGKKIDARPHLACYINAMSKTSVTKSGRAAKSVRSATVKSARSATVKKSAKLPRSLAKKAMKPQRLSRAAVRSSRARASKPNQIVHTASPPMQPMAASTIVLQSHKYQVGEVVYYTSPSFGRAAATGSYTVVKLLPSEGDDYQYRIKNNGEAFERVAKESQLDRA
jgi:hypothetical protein